MLELKLGQSSSSSPSGQSTTPSHFCTSQIRLPRLRHGMLVSPRQSSSGSTGGRGTGIGICVVVAALVVPSVVAGAAVVGGALGVAAKPNRKVVTLCHQSSWKPPKGEMNQRVRY